MTARGAELFGLVLTLMSQRDAGEQSLGVAAVMYEASPIIATLTRVGSDAEGTPEGEAVDTAIEALLDGSVLCLGLLKRLGDVTGADPENLRQTMLTALQGQYE